MSPFTTKLYWAGDKRNCPWTMHVTVALSDVDTFDGIGSSVGVTRGRNNSDQSVPLHLLLLKKSIISFFPCGVVSCWCRTSVAGDDPSGGTHHGAQIMPQARVCMPC